MNQQELRKDLLQKSQNGSILQPQMENQQEEKQIQCQDGQDQADIGSDIWIQEIMMLLSEKMQKLIGKMWTPILEGLST